MTPSEATLWAHLRNNQLAGLHFRRQQVIDGYIVDFYCPRASLIVEVDGKIHERTSDQDASRTEALAARGLSLIRFRNEEVDTDIASVVRRIREACGI